MNGAEGLLGIASAFKGFNEGMKDAEDRKYKQMEMDAKLEAQKQDRERQRTMDESANRMNLFKVREQGYLIPEGTQSVNDLDMSALEHDPQALALKKRVNPGAGGVVAPGGGRRLSAPDTLKVQEGDSIPGMLDDVETTIGASEDIFGPVAGRLGAANPYDTRAQTVDSQIRTASQSFGRYMEGGVLRKEDEEKYRKMFPQLKDTPEVAKNKLAIVRKMLIDKQNANVAALGSQGYSTRGFSKRESPSLPGLLTKKPGLVPQGKIAKPPGAFADKGPKVGEIQDGYEFQGGDPANSKSWRKK